MQPKRLDATGHLPDLQGHSTLQSDSRFLMLHCDRRILQFWQPKRGRDRGLWCTLWKCRLPIGEWPVPHFARQVRGVEHSVAPGEDTRVCRRWERRRPIIISMTRKTVDDEFVAHDVLTTCRTYPKGEAPAAYKDFMKCWTPCGLAA